MCSTVEIGVWIGATRTSPTEFKWEDDTKMVYSNWGKDSPSNITGRDCVAMQSKFSKFETEGTWKDVSCSSPNYFVCETAPIWSPDEMQLVLIETRKKLDDLLKNPVPIGFKYTQLPGQPEPTALWPVVKWKEITGQYAGQFFRALGGASAEFGATQNADSPRLISVKHSTTGSYGNDPISINPGSWSPNNLSGDKGWSGDNLAMNFLVSNVETRPINTAIRIWMRES